jgi:hypothetical protein
MKGWRLEKIQLIDQAFQVEVMDARSFSSTLSAR